MRVRHGSDKLCIAERRAEAPWSSEKPSMQEIEKPLYGEGRESELKQGVP